MPHPLLINNTVQYTKLASFPRPSNIYAIIHILLAAVYVMTDIVISHCSTLGFPVPVLKADEKGFFFQVSHPLLVL